MRIDKHVFGTWEHERKAGVLRKSRRRFQRLGQGAAKSKKAFDKLLNGLPAEEGSQSFLFFVGLCAFCIAGAPKPKRTFVLIRTHALFSCARLHRAAIGV
jgi:hypothetical protein